MQSFRSPSLSNINFEGTEFVRVVEAKYPALLFKQQLTAYVEKIYGIINTNFSFKIMELNAISKNL